MSVPAILDLWSLGHSAADIAEKLGIKARAIHMIAEQAREIGDPRAVVHLGRNGRPLGRPLLEGYSEAVPAVRKRFCVHGHLRDPDLVHCKDCNRLRTRARRAK